MQKDHTAFDIRASASTSSTATPKPARKDQPAMSGKRWTQAEEREMINLFLSGTSLEDIAANFQRTTLAILQRFLKHSPSISRFIVEQQETIEDLKGQFVSMRRLAEKLLKDNIAKSAPMIGNSA